MPPVPVRRPKVIGIVGSRRRNSDADFRSFLAAFEAEYRDGDTLVSGGCEQGGDLFAERLARSRGMTITIHHAAWRGKTGRGPTNKAAGFERNTLIAESCDVLIAVVAEDRKGGTEDTVRKALKLGKPVVLVK